jgi:hypothetical protein
MERMNMNNVTYPLVNDPWELYDMLMKRKLVHDKNEFIKQIQGKTLFDINFSDEARRVGEQNNNTIRSHSGIAYKNANIDTKTRYKCLADEIKNIHLNEMK